MENEQGRADVAAQTVDAITLSSVPQQQRRMREYHEIRTIDNSQQVDDVSKSFFMYLNILVFNIVINLFFLEPL